MQFAQSRTCHTCGIEKPLAFKYFAYAENKRADGLRTLKKRCRACDCAATRASRMKEKQQAQGEGYTANAARAFARPPRFSPSPACEPAYV